MPESGKSGSVGAAGEQLPVATRRLFHSPHPNPLPAGEGALRQAFATPRARGKELEEELSLPPSPGER